MAPTACGTITYKNPCRNTKLKVIFQPAPYEGVCLESVFSFHNSCVESSCWLSNKVYKFSYTLPMNKTREQKAMSFFCVAEHLGARTFSTDILETQ